MTIRNYYFDYDKLLEEYLNYKGIKNDTGDADITCIEIDDYAHHDTNFVALIIGYTEWLKKNQICVDVCYYVDDEGKKVYDYEEMHDAFELSMSKLDR